ncbi:proline dehydrogenase transcriptional activator [Pseudooceanicola batsensis HTCC2597]|uniref:Proline dehydrogenase transcriptional activator n=1 Tax=Pseudooceanicola batsensis (strain ATCC BAA-863 / DSM 15984 / KCTC 12145 / HTCC2597) TaxID=252305 RepID=A3TZ99_PSEBH|nr:Lrp/AsnC ligand binding domain-containing protein [Pseudooceanicola batsensis]EAQ02917.1 proline dehydrogenase transcriptional activator [Pseudooceanicola batsensis HTCC2597]
MSENTDELDRIDRRILSALAKDARLSMAALADRVGLSKTPVTVRVKRLESEGYIQGYHAALDAGKLGLAQVAFVQVTLERTTADALDAFNAAVRAAPEIAECHMIAGGYDYLLKIRTRDVAAYRRALTDLVAHLPHVAQTSTFMAMEVVKDGAAVGVTP